MAAKLVRLDAWLAATYGKAIAIDTAYRWIRAGKILPRPEKHGRAYFLHPDARYTDRPDKPRLLDRLRAEASLPG